MTAKEELRQLISSLTPEELETALKVFREYSSARQGVQQPPFQKDQK